MIFRTTDMKQNRDFSDSTIIAPATVAGTGAISIIRISGKDAFETVDAIVSFRKGNAMSAKGYSIKYGVIYKTERNVEQSADSPACAAAHGTDSTAKEVLDEVLCCIYRAPHSYTGEDSVEIMCHASAYIVGEILAIAMEHGCRMAAPGEFTQRAFLSGKMDLAQAEAVADVISSSNEMSHRVAINQLRGGFSSDLASLREQLLEMTSLLELELDFSEEDVEFADRSRLNALVDTVIDHISRLAGSFKLGNAIKNGIPVTIAGATNAGKSTLLNSILGEQRAIVSDIAGTTRDTVEECFNVGGILFRFVDTAGIRTGNVGEIERIGIERSFESIRKADIVIIVLDAFTLTDTLSNYAENELTPSSVSSIAGDGLNDILSKVDWNSQHIIFALNKMDLTGKIEECGIGLSGHCCGNKNVNSKNNLVSYIENQILINKEDDSDQSKVDIVEISAKKGRGINVLLEVLTESQKERLKNASASDSILVTNLRHYEALVTARKHLLDVRTDLNSGTPSDLVAEDLRAALSALGTITGTISSQDVLNNIFGKFCIGK